MFANLFSQEGFLWRWLNVVTDIFILSMLWFLCSIPLVTIGASTTALYDASVHCIRYKEPHPYKRFFRTFKSDLPVTIGSTLLWAVIITVCVLTVKYLFALGEYSESAYKAAAAYYVVLILPLGAACWVFPILSRFTFGFIQLNLTALKLAVARLPSTLILVLLTLEVAQLTAKYAVPIMFTPALTALIWSLFIERAFTKLGGGLKKYSENTEPEVSDESLTDDPENGEK